ncbi:MAG: response regulator [Sphingomonadales bacterium]|nr:MAG: response regulator [Sphingomonadales bacterium]
MTGPIILVVEDEPLILADIESALQDGGYEVVSATTAAEAMRHLEGDEAFSGLISDIRLAGEKLSGWDIAQRAREMSPSIGVIYTSGDSGAEWASRGVPESIFVQKPFASAQIVTAISTVLNSGGGSRPGAEKADT